MGNKDFVLVTKQQFSGLFFALDSLIYTFIYQKQPPEVFYKKRCSEKFRKFHRKTPVLESLLIKLQAYSIRNIVDSEFFLLGTVHIRMSELVRLGKLTHLGEMIFIPRSYGIFYLTSLKKFLCCWKKIVFTT